MTHGPDGRPPRWYSFVMILIAEAVLFVLMVLAGLYALRVVLP